MKIILIRVLAKLAQLIIVKYQPSIVTVTGSYGKSSTKEAVYAVLKDNAPSGRSQGSYNNELGLPLAILGESSPGRSVVGWLRLYFKAIHLLLINDASYPKVLVLEMGADKPGDIAQLVKIAPPQVSVLTAISNVHRENYKSLDDIATEKRTLINSLGDRGVAILNADDKLVASTVVPRGVKVLTYGVHTLADVRGSEPRLWFTMKNGEVSGGVRFKIEYAGSVIPLQVPGTLGEPVMYAALAAFAVGVARGGNPLDVARALDNYQPLPGRLRLLNGIKDTAIIDDSYNASPDAMRAAIAVLCDEVFAGHRKVAVLGDMRELGAVSDESHAEIGVYVASHNIDLLVTVGARAKGIANSATEAGMPIERVVSFDDAVSAGKYVQQHLESGDVVLVKGSQGKGADMIRLERVVKEIMQQPELAEFLLVRQGKQWQIE